MRVVVVYILSIVLFVTCTQVNDVTRDPVPYEKFYYNETSVSKDSAWYRGSDTIVIVENDTFYLRSRDTAVFHAGLGMTTEITVYDTVIKVYEGSSLTYIRISGGDTLYPVDVVSSSSIGDLLSSTTDTTVSGSSGSIGSSFSDSAISSSSIDTIISSSSLEPVPELSISILNTQLLDSASNNGSTVRYSILLKNSDSTAAFSVDIHDLILRYSLAYTQISMDSYSNLAFGDSSKTQFGIDYHTIDIGELDSVSLLITYTVPDAAQVLLMAYGPSSFYEKVYYTVLNDSLYQVYRNNL